MGENNTNDLRKLTMYVCMCMYVQKLKSILLPNIYNGHTKSLSKHSDNIRSYIAIDKQVCFYRWQISNLSSYERPKQTCGVTEGHQ